MVAHATRKEFTAEEKMACSIEAMRNGEECEGVPITDPSKDKTETGADTLRAASFWKHIAGLIHHP